MSDKFYAAVCFLILMKEDGGMKHHNYIEEKIRMLECGLDAFAWLDIPHMGQVIAYLKMSQLDVPETWIQNYILQLRDAKDSGIL